MHNKELPSWETVHTIVFDFDGIFTDNKVFVDENGLESVKCDRADGLAFDILRKFIKRNNWNLEYFILSREKNKVVLARANKLDITCYNNIINKHQFLEEYLFRRFNNNKDVNKGMIYLGNDINDLKAMNIAGFSVAPIDAHPFVAKYVDLILDKCGGDGFVRSFIEKLLRLDELDKNGLNNLL